MQKCYTENLALKLTLIVIITIAICSLSPSSEELAKEPPELHPVRASKPLQEKEPVEARSFVVEKPKAPPKAPVKPVAPVGKEHYASLVAKYFPAKELPTAYRIITCESNWNPRAFNGVDRGIFQINKVHSGRVGGNLDSLFDPETNVRVAHAIWSEQYWNPWTCY